LLLAAGTATAQTKEEPATQPKSGVEKAERRAPSMFHRPTASMPSDQLAYANERNRAGRLKAAGAEYLALVHQWHESPEAPEAQLGYARTLIARRKYDAAFSELQYLADHFPGRFPFEDVLTLQYQVANAIRARRRMAFLGFKGFADPGNALPLYEAIVRNAAFWKHAAEVQLQIGMIQEEGGERELAILAYEGVMQRHALTSVAEQAAFRRAECWHQISRENSRDEESCRSALSALSGFLRDFPRSEYAAVARSHLEERRSFLARQYYDRAVYYDRIVRKPGAAIIAYKDFIRKFPDTPLAEVARSRVDQLELQPKTGAK
jgi:outer membrane protein assembly factor BamD (BamD/ComL family)